MSLSFPIKGNHLLESEQFSNKNNPVSLAIKERIPAFNLEVENKLAFIGKTVFKLSRKVQQWIKDYDDKVCTIKTLPDRQGIMYNLPECGVVIIDLVKREIRFKDE